MGHNNKKTLVYQMFNVLKSKQGYGRSKHDDKAKGIAHKYI